MPSGSATATETIRVAIVRAIVGSIRCPISSVTGRSREYRHAEIAVQQPPHPGAELDVKRPVQPQSGMDAGDLLAGGIVAGDYRGRVARTEMQQPENEQRHHRHYRDGREDAAHDVAYHGGALCLDRSDQQQSQDCSKFRAAPSTGSVWRDFC